MGAVRASASVHFLSPSAREPLIPTWDSPSHLVDHAAFVRQRFGIQNPSFPLRRSGPHLLSGSCRTTGRAVSVSQGGVTWRGRGCLFQTGAHRCRGLSEGAEGKAEAFWEQPDQGLHGLSKLFLILQKTAPETGVRLVEQLGERMAARPALAALRTALGLAVGPRSPLSDTLRWALWSSFSR